MGNAINGTGMISYHGWRKLTAALLRGDPVCRIAGPGCTTRATQVDHIVPRSAGGTDELSNLRVCCATCNYKRAKTIKVWAPRGQLFPDESR